MPAPTLRTAASNKGAIASGTGAAMSVQLPGTPVAGDVAVLIFAWNASNGSLRAADTALSVGAVTFTQRGLYSHAAGTANAAVRMAVYSAVLPSGYGGANIENNLSFSAGGSAAWIAAALIIQNATSAVPAFNSISGDATAGLLYTSIEVPAAAGQTSDDMAIALYAGNAAAASPIPGFSVASPYGMAAQTTEQSTNRLALVVPTNSTGTVSTATITATQNMRTGILGQLVFAPAPSAPALSGRATLSGTSAITATGTAKVNGSGRAALAGTATLSVTGEPRSVQSGAAVLTGTSTVTVSGEAATTPPPEDPEEEPPGEEAPPPEEQEEDLTPAPDPDEEQPVAATAHGTLTANQVKTVSVTAGRNGGVVVVNRNQEGVIWVRMDGIAPAIEGAGSYAVFGTHEFDLGYRKMSQQVNVSMVSDANRTYTVEGY